MLSNNVKLVIWDLDETFWKGTLAEGEITPIDAYTRCVITLAERGIISSICSKNNFETAKAALIKIGVWDYFVFPRIEFGPKGQNIAAMIEEMALRAENVLFIDDNVLNLEEAKHYAPGLMAAHPDEILASLLSLPQVAGKDDRQLSRLQQYKALEVKAVERSKSTVSNEEFLRECDIRVTIDHNLEENFDRIVEMANRTNQLNFTKKRLETPEAIEEFRKLCSKHGVATGVIHVTDKYGDYGVVGYYVVFRHARGNELLHFAFSCRTMNMGIEQYVYEYLREPLVKIVPPVSNPIKCFDKIDWIKEGKGAFEAFSQLETDKRLVLLGGCELLQLATLCGSRRSEFVNTFRDGVEIRFDDLGFVLSNRHKMAGDEAVKKLGYWTYEDAIAFDDSLKSAHIAIISPAAFFWWDYFVSNSGTITRPVTPTLKKRLATDGMFFIRNFQRQTITLRERDVMFEQALERIADLTPSTCHRFALGQNTLGVPEDHPSLPGRRRFNENLKRLCAKYGFFFVDIGSIVEQQDLVNSDHYTRRGHMALANFISGCISGEQHKEKTEPEAGPQPHSASPELVAAAGL
jgi:FkbH-like protein